MANQCCLQAFLRLLLIGYADGTLLNALSQITDQIAVKCYVVVSRREYSLLQQDIQILARHQKGGIF